MCLNHSHWLSSSQSLFLLREVGISRGLLLRGGVGILDMKSKYLLASPIPCNTALLQDIFMQNPTEQAETSTDRDCVAINSLNLNHYVTVHLGKR
jgi:hypothetical protein